MRIGIDMLGVQSPASCGRGIGRYARGLVDGLLKVNPHREYILYTHPGLPTDAFPVAAHARVCPLPNAPTAERSLELLARDNPDRLDALLLTSPFELHNHYSPPAKPLNGLILASIVYDLVAFRFQEDHLTYPPIAAQFYRNLERLRSYDALLAISDATRDDVYSLIGSTARVVSISAASDPSFFTPADPELSPDEVATLARLGIDRPFVFGLGAADARKNLPGLLAAFALLPIHLRAAHQLVVAGLDGESTDALIFTGPVSDVDLRVLYRRCTVFAFPSRFEGFGLPLLEAAHCGAAIVGGNNSSQPEVVGDAGLLVDVDNPAELAEAMATLLDNPSFARRLAERAAARASQFTWERSARRALDAMTPRLPRRARKPWIAVVSSWAPKRSPVSILAARLIEELKRSYQIHLYHESGYVPDLALASPDYAAFDHRVFRRNASVMGYQAVIYEVAGSAYHDFLAPLIRESPGIVTLHDPDRACLAREYATAIVVRPGVAYSEAEDSGPRVMRVNPDSSWPALAAMYTELIESRPIEDAARTGSLPRYRIDAPEVSAPFRSRPEWSQTR